jgi:hypothetical protein
VGVADGAVELAGGHGIGIGGFAGALEGTPRRARGGTLRAAISGRNGT